jgi:hypothetical protein
LKGAKTMNKYTVTVVVSIEVPVVTNSSDEACAMAERVIGGRLDAFGNVVGIEAVCWEEDE